MSKQQRKGGAYVSRLRRRKAVEARTQTTHAKPVASQFTMLSARPRIDQNAQNVHYNLTMKTPAKPSTSNTLGASTILRTNLKENTANRAALLKTAPRAHIIPSTPILKKPVTSMFCPSSRSPAQLTVSRFDNYPRVQCLKREQSAKH